LPKANAFMAFANPAMIRLAGPALGGVVIAASGKPGVAFLVDAATFCLSAALLVPIRTRPAADAGKQTSRDVIAEIRKGLSFVRAHPWCWAHILGVGLSMLAWYGPVQVLLPYILKIDLGLGQAGGARQLGLILAFGGLGSMVVSVVVGQRNDLPRRFVTVMFATEGIGMLVLGVYGLMTQAWQGMVAGLVAFGLFAVGQIIWATTLQRLVPTQLLGRVASVDLLVSTALGPVSFGLAGLLSTVFSARDVIVAGSLAGAAIMITLLRVPGVRDPDDPIRTL
jgi:MFS transporter, DHA3 family, tetracycline resistance protein